MQLLSGRRQLARVGFRAQGFDIGSGPTEALCRTLTARLKGGGKRWNTPNAEALMALAALKHSRLWEGYWAVPAREGRVTCRNRWRSPCHSSCNMVCRAIWS